MSIILLHGRQQFYRAYRSLNGLRANRIIPSFSREFLFRKRAQSRNLAENAEFMSVYVP